MQDGHTHSPTGHTQQADIPTDLSEKIGDLTVSGVLPGHNATDTYSQGAGEEPSTSDPSFPPNE